MVPYHDFSVGDESTPSNQASALLRKGPAAIEQELSLEFPEGFESMSQDQYRRFVDILTLPIRSPIAAREARLEHLPLPASIDEYFKDKLKDQSNYHALLRLLWFKPNKTLLLETHQSLTDAKIKLNRTLRVALIRAYSKIKDINTVQTLWNDLDPHSSNDFTLLCDAYSKAKQIDKAFEIIQKMVEAKFEPTIHIYTRLMQACLAQRNSRKAWEVWNHMRAIKRIEPDQKAYATIIRACALDKEAERAINLFEEMKQEHLIPTEESFHAVMNVCVTRKDFYEHTFLLMEQMKASGLFPTIKTYELLLAAAARYGDIRTAERLFEDVKELGEANAQTYAHLIKAYAINQRKVDSKQLMVDNCNKALAIHDEMANAGISKSHFTYLSVLSTFVFGDFPGKAMMIFRQMESEGLTHNVKSYTAMIQVLANTRRVETMLQIYKEMKANRIEPSMRTYEYLVKGLAKGKYLKSTMNYLREMRAKGWIPHHKVIKLLQQRFREYPDLLREVNVLTEEVVEKEKFNRRDLLRLRMRQREGKQIHIRLI